MAYASSHPIWMDRAITAILAVGLVTYAAWVLSSIAELKKNPAWQLLMSRNLLRAIDALTNPLSGGRQPVRLVATEQGAPLANELVQILQHCNWELKVNHDNASHVFPAMGGVLKVSDCDIVQKQMDGGLFLACLNTLSNYL